MDNEYSLLTGQLPSDDDSCATDHSVGDTSLFSDGENSSTDGKDTMMQLDVEMEIEF